MLEAGPGVLGVPGKAEEHGAGGQRGSGLPGQVRARPTLTEAEGWPGVSVNLSSWIKQDDVLRVKSAEKAEREA